jgi:hypothetical protein
MAGPTWVIDTSALIDIRNLPRDRRPALNQAMTNLVISGRLRSPKQVVDELKRVSDATLEWALSVETKAVEDSPTLDEVKATLALVPDVLDPEKDSGADEADPYVLAMALKLKEAGVDARVVTQETKDRPTKTSLNTAAGIVGVPSVPLAGFLRVEGIS